MSLSPRSKTAVLAVLTLPILPSIVGGQGTPNPMAQSLADLNESPTAGVEIPPELGSRAARRATSGGLPYESRGTSGMSPHATAPIACGSQV
jgi:hypothetical protein